MRGVTALSQAVWPIEAGSHGQLKNRINVIPEEGQVFGTTKRMPLGIPTLPYPRPRFES